MASKVHAVKNDAAGYTFRCVLFAQSDNQIKSNPTLASGDWTISKDGGAFANLATLPDVDPDSTMQVKVVLSQAETNADEVVIIGKDASGAEWHSVCFVLHTVAAGYDSLSTLTTAQVNAEADTAIGDAALATAAALSTVAGNVSSILSHTGTVGVVISTAQMEAISDIIASRGAAHVEDTAEADSPAAMALAMFHSSMSGGTWTIYKTDNATAFDIVPITTDAAAEPVIGAANT